MGDETLNMVSSITTQQIGRPTATEATISERSVAKALIAITLFLVSAHIAALILKYGLGREHAFGFVGTFHMDGEMNVPSFMSSLLLFSTAMMAFFTAAVTPGDRRSKLPWLTVGLVFVLLSFDENIRIHERITNSMRAILPEGFMPYTGFEIPYLIVMGIIGLFMIRWYLNLDRSSQLLFALSGFIFVCGAVGLEQVASVYYDANGLARAGEATLVGDVFVLIEETCEIAGVSLFLYAMVRRLGGIKLASADTI
ncbi:MULTISPECIES: hypothetical protein [Hyphomonas]|nr:MULTISPECIES: hypothetical protein [Hyphomonas]